MITTTPSKTLHSDISTPGISLRCTIVGELSVNLARKKLIMKDREHDALEFVSILRAEIGNIKTYKVAATHLPVLLPRLEHRIHEHACLQFFAVSNFFLHLFLLSQPLVEVVQDWAKDSRRLSLGPIPYHHYLIVGRRPVASLRRRHGSFHRTFV